MTIYEYITHEIEQGDELAKNEEPVAKAFFTGQALALKKLYDRLHAGEVTVV